jgi:high affinity Mn2+ porin
VVEIEHAHSLSGHPGKLRALAFRNRAVMSRYEDALALAHATGTTPDLNAVRTQVHAKTGVGLALEQELTPDLGAWARINRNDGASETYVFTTIDQAAAAGFVLKGTKWNRPADSFGLGVARNALSSAHRQYLAEGGLDYFIGDGRLNYQPEWITEAYYTLAAGKHAWLTLDFQHIRNPAYNADRGPAKVWGARLHAEF